MIAICRHAPSSQTFHEMCPGSRRRRRILPGRTREMPGGLRITLSGRMEALDRHLPGEFSDRRGSPRPRGGEGMPTRRDVLRLVPAAAFLWAARAAEGPAYGRI